MWENPVRTEKPVVPFYYDDNTARQSCLASRLLSTPPSMTALRKLKKHSSVAAGGARRQYLFRAVLARRVNEHSIKSVTGWLEVDDGASPGMCAGAFGRSSHRGHNSKGALDLHRLSGVEDCVAVYGDGGRLRDKRRDRTSTAQQRSRRGKCGRAP